MAAGPCLTKADVTITTATTTKIFDAPGDLPYGYGCRNTIWEVDSMDVDYKLSDGTLHIGDNDSTANADAIYFDAVGLSGHVSLDFTNGGTKPGKTQATTSNLPIIATTTGDAVDVHVTAWAHKVRVIRA